MARRLSERFISYMVRESPSLPLHSPSLMLTVMSVMSHRDAQHGMPDTVRATPPRSPVEAVAIALTASS